MFKKSILLLILVVPSFLTGCASVPMASLAADNNAKQFAVSPNKANIYLYRNESFGGAVAMPVSFDGQIAGRTGPNTYFYWSVEAGEYEIASLTENTARIKVNARAGRNHFIWQEVKMGTWAARSELHEVSEEEGRKGVRECKLAIATNQSAPTKVTSVKAAESTQNKAASVEAPTLKGTPNCTTASILGMKELGMSDTQIKAACPDPLSESIPPIAVAVFPFARSGMVVTNDADHLLPEFAHQYISENRQLRLSASYFKQKDSKIGSETDYWSTANQPLTSRIYGDGARIDADAVLMYSYLGRYTMEDSFDVTVYLFDVKNRRTYQSSGNQNNYKRVTESLFKKITAIQ